MAEENSPNCFGKVKEFATESYVEDIESECANSSETYTVESDFDVWNKVSRKYTIVININSNSYVII